MKRRYLYLIFLLAMIVHGSSICQEALLPPEALESAPYSFRKQFLLNEAAVSPVIKTPGKYTFDDWAAIIDATWGEGLPVEEKLEIFDTFVNKIDASFVCFQHLECDAQLIDWNAMAAELREEVEDTVSRGRFAAIMHRLCLALRESHTYADDAFVMGGYALSPGLPLLVVGGWGNNAHFGAGLTPLPDSTLLVYDALSNHVLGLVPGDIVLGYDGIPWKELYKEMIAVQMPIWGWWWGSCPSAHTHSWLMSAGMNWHLFDTLDVVKYASGDTLHLATSPLASQPGSIFCTEQLDIDGVPKPNYYGQEICSYGIVDGTNIGYIYVWGWFWEAEDEFLEAVSDLMDNYDTEGLIIDFRMNYGGNMFLSDLALELLFNTQDSTIFFKNRNDPDNHCSWTNGSSPGGYIIQGDPTTFYDKPIAVLTGPGALSSGDQVALRMKFHPMARVFGKSTAAAFNSPSVINFTDEDWTGRYAQADACLVSNPDSLLTHLELEVDQEVWHTQEAVAQGKDAVVEAAIDWILYGITGEVEQPLTGQKDGNIVLTTYPTPITNHCTIEFFIPVHDQVTIKVFNAQGKEIETVFTGHIEAGTHRIVLDLNQLEEGMYFFRLHTSHSIATCKTIRIEGE